MKKERHQLIRQIIEVQNIETQEELAKALLERGYDVTQATVSRDIKEMMLIKVPNVRGGYSYAFPKEHNHSLTPEKLERTLRESVINVRCGGNLVVLHTLPGTASGVAFVIDSMKCPSVLGTVAGDDTIFTALDSPDSAPEFIRYFGLEHMADPFAQLVRPQARGEGAALLTEKKERKKTTRKATHKNV